VHPKPHRFMSNQPLPTVLPPLIVGEVLFDHFPDGNRVLGGAPFNVAWNLRGFGLSPAFFSAVGDDENGHAVRERMRDWRMSERGLQTVPEHPTGMVHIKHVDGRPQYSIEHPAAYDALQWPKFPVTADEFSLLYMGSLAWRGNQTRETMRRLVDRKDVPRFVDVNIRQPWFDRDWLPELFGDARWVKVSDEELQWLAGTETELQEAQDVIDAVHQLQERYGGIEYFVTCGAFGSYWVAENQVTFAPASPVEKIEDTVGAGDAFVAATLFGLLQGLPREVTLRAANQFAARICTLRGATTDDETFYQWPETG